MSWLMATPLEPPRSKGKVERVDALDLTKIRAIVAGHDRTYPRRVAMARLLRSGHPNKHRDFEKVLEDEKEDREARYLAAMHLGRLNTPEAREILIRLSRTNEERALFGIASALGRIGDGSSLEALAAIKKRAQGGGLARRAAVSAMLISYRLGLSGNDLPVPTAAAYRDLPEEIARPIRFDCPFPDEANLCLRSLALEPFGVEYSERSIMMGRIGQCQWMLLLNREFADVGDVKDLLQRKFFLGAIAAKDRSTGLYSHSFLLMSAPAAEKWGADVLVCRSSGEILFGGKAEVGCDRARFLIRGIAKPGIPPLSIAGELSEGKVTVERGVSALFVEKQRPRKS